MTDDRDYFDGEQPRSCGWILILAALAWAAVGLAAAIVWRILR